MKGFKTVIFGLIVAIGPTTIAYLGGIDWVSIGISPTIASALGLAIIALRAVTSTPIGSKS